MRLAVTQHATEIDLQVDGGEALPPDRIVLERQAVLEQRGAAGLSAQLLITEAQHPGTALFDLIELRIETAHLYHQRRCIERQLCHQAPHHLGHWAADNGDADVGTELQQQSPERSGGGLNSPCRWLRKPRADIGEAAQMQAFLVPTMPASVAEVSAHPECAAARQCEDNEWWRAIAMRHGIPHGIPALARRWLIVWICACSELTAWISAHMKRRLADVAMPALSTNGSPPAIMPWVPLEPGV